MNFAAELLERFSPAINVKHALLRLTSSSFPSGMSVEYFYSKQFLPSLLQTREPDSWDRALLFCQKLFSGIKEAVLKVPWELFGSNTGVYTSGKQDARSLIIFKKGMNLDLILYFQDGSEK
jgi:hypothetical protein